MQHGKTRWYLLCVRSYPQITLTEQAMKQAEKTTPTTSLHDGVMPLMSEATEQADALLTQGVNALRNTSENLQERAHQVGELTSDYVRKEPVKSLLIAAAAGAVLMGLVSVLSRSHTSR
jgi:ElaB/YqjD/DUF883 family membrane-anchored ribosome-binding protein